MAGIAGGFVNLVFRCETGRFNDRRLCAHRALADACSLKEGAPFRSSFVPVRNADFDAGARFLAKGQVAIPVALRPAAAEKIGPSKPATRAQTTKLTGVTLHGL